MSKLKGRKIADAITTFNADAMREDGGVFDLYKIGQTLQIRTLGNKHFKQALEQIEQMRQAMELPFH